MENDVLYHFVGWGCPHDHDSNFETLCTILNSMRVGRYPDDDPAAGIRLVIQAGGPLEKGELIQQSITCFCDIPFEQLKIHAAKYGRFGVGVSRRMLCTFGARPVSYVPRPSSRPDAWGHTLARDLRSLIAGVQDHLHPSGSWSKNSIRAVGASLDCKEDVLELLESVLNKELLAFLKFFDSDLPSDHPENYYMEREWRKFLPMPLEQSLEQVVVPPEFASQFIGRFPMHAAKLKILGA